MSPASLLIRSIPAVAVYSPVIRLPFIFIGVVPHVISVSLAVRDDEMIVVLAIPRLI
jgi:hypothetical protein